VSEPQFPPLMYGEEASAGAFDHAMMRAVQGCDAGMVGGRASGMDGRPAGQRREMRIYADRILIAGAC